MLKFSNLMEEELYKNNIVDIEFGEFENLIFVLREGFYLFLFYYSSRSDLILGFLSSYQRNCDRKNGGCKK